jgi:hypothetical protein
MMQQQQMMMVPQPGMVYQDPAMMGGMVAQPVAVDNSPLEAIDLGSSQINGYGKEPEGHESFKNLLNGATGPRDKWSSGENLLDGGSQHVKMYFTITLSQV